MLPSGICGGDGRDKKNRSTCSGGLPESHLVGRPLHFFVNVRANSRMQSLTNLAWLVEGRSIFYSGISLFDFPPTNKAKFVEDLIHEFEFVPKGFSRLNSAIYS